MIEYLFFFVFLFFVFCVFTIVNYSEKNRNSRTLTFLFIGVFAAMLFAFGSILTAAPVFLPKITGINFSLIGVLMILSAIICFLHLSVDFRKKTIGLLRLDMNPDSAIHAFGMMLFFSSIILAASFFFVFNSIPLDKIDETGFNAEIKDLTLFDIILNEIPYIILAFIGCGFLIRRNLKDILIRFGVVKPRLNEILLGVAVGVALVFASGFIGLFFTEVLGFPKEQNLDILKNLMSVEGAIVIGLSAGVCEEILFRGALQPKFGILLTSVLFALLHFQYGALWMLLVIFVLSVSLGYLRNRTNTTTCMIAHTCYNASQILIVLMFAP